MKRAGRIAITHVTQFLDASREFSGQVIDRLAAIVVDARVDVISPDFIATMYFPR
jgi:hypothetical protein